ncbi:hypothetical protein [Saccharothrix deserti]|uniref:hypothetical protein n=1 Tax=Saccharothrix deserti TaxID=2593674 RepID=UPI00131E5D42|nr:hypothetical protein [Saccharothrix deserti]
MSGGRRVPLALLAHDERSEAVYRAWAAQLAEHASAVVLRLDQDPARAAEELRRLPPDVPTVHLAASQALWAALRPAGGSRWDADVVLVLDTGQWPAQPFGERVPAAGTLRLIVISSELDGPAEELRFATEIPGAELRIRLLPGHCGQLLGTGSPVPEVLRAVLRTEMINAVRPPNEWPGQEGQP